MVLPPAFVSSPSTFQGRNRDYIGGEGEVDFLDADDGMPDPSSIFMAIMDFVYKTFPEACGPAPQESAPILPGILHGEVHATTPSLKQAQPIDFMMSQASVALVHANESTRLSFVKYPAQLYHRCY